MKSLWNKLHKFGDFLHLPDIPNWLLGIMFFAFLLRVPSFFEPYYYGDEMIYMTLGQGVRQGLTLYKDLHDNKPPLLYLTAAAAGNLFWFKVILAFWCVITIFIFYKLAKVILEKNTKAQKISTIIFAVLTTLPLLEGLTVNSELFMMVFTIGALLILLRSQLKTKNIFFAGVLLGIGALYKIPAAFDAPVIVIYWLITKGFKEWKVVLKDTFILMLGFASPILLTFIWYFIRGTLSDYIKAAFMQNVGYLSSYRPGDIQKSFIEKNGPLLVRAGVVFVGSAIVYILRKRLSKKFILLTIWTLFALFAVTLSERPYPHYFIQVVAPLSMLFSILFAEKSVEQSLVVIPLAITFFVPFYYKFWLYPTIPYYVRFVRFAVGVDNKFTYLNKFSENINQDYEVSEFLKNSSIPGDKVYVWDPNAPSIYALSKRLPPVKYVVPYHVNDYSNKNAEATKIALSLPKFIIINIDYQYPELNGVMRNNYILVNRIGRFNIYSRINFAPTK